MRTQEDILKHNYIIEHLENAEFKTKELIILSALCFDSKLWNIKPVFQLPLKKDFNSFYFFDLYYPALNLIIEVDEEHHETASEKQNDKLKELKAKDELDCHFYRICYHEKYGNVGEQIEKVKERIFELVNQIGEEKTKWREHQFNPSDYLQQQEKTILVSVSPKNKVNPLNKMPLQIRKPILDIDELNIIYLTGHTGTVASVYKVTPNDWISNGGNPYHNGKLDYENPIITSGSTFYKGTKNIQLSPDLEVLKKRSNNNR